MSPSSLRVTSRWRLACELVEAFEAFSQKGSSRGAMTATSLRQRRSQESSMSDDASESLAAARLVDARCDEFEKALAAGSLPVIEAFLAGLSPTGRQALLVELVGLEIDFHVARGEPPQIQDYAARFPELSGELLAEIIESSLLKPNKTPTQDVQERAVLAPTILSPTDEVVLANHAATAAGLRRIQYFGDYELLREIARGGMGVVYEARQRSLNRPVALKMILSGRLASAEEVTRFRREAEAAAQLEHPGIVPIFEIGTDGDQHYFTMGYVAGPSLSARLLERPLEPREAATLIRDVALAVQYAHERGVVHRDLKPSNILLAPRTDGSHVRQNVGQTDGRQNVGQTDGRQNVGQTDVRPHSGECGYDTSCGDTPRITDFGLAKFSHADKSLTETGQILGTPSYMPPEQAAGLTNQVGPAADIYSLGAVLYACLTGRPPFQAASAIDTVRQVLERDPVSLRDLNVSIPQDLETISLKCLEKSIPRRYATAKEVADELQRYLEGRPIEARPVSRLERVWRWCRRNPVVAGLSAGVALSLLLGTVISSFFAWKENQRAIAESDARHDEELQRREADRQTGIAKKLGADNLKLAEDEKSARQKADLNAEAAKEQTKLAKRHLYSAHLNLTQAAWEASRVAEVTRLLDLYRPAAGQIADVDDLRGFEWYYWDRCCKSDRLTFQAPRLLQSLAFSRDGKWLASASYNRFLATALPGEVKIWDAATGRELRTLKGHTDGVNCVTFSPDGKLVASASADATVKIWETNTGQCLLTFQGHSANVECVSFSNDGRRMASGSTNRHPNSFGSELKLWDATSGKELRTLERGREFMQCVTFSSDDQQLASAGIANVKLWNAETGEELQLLKHEPADVTSDTPRWSVSGVAFSPDGKLLASASMDQTIKLWNISTGKELSTLRGHTNGVTGVVFTPDGQRLLSSSSDQTIRIWNVGTGQELSSLKGHTDVVVDVAINSAGTRFASADASGAIKQWDAETHQKARPLEVTEGCRSLAFRHDGQLLAAASLWKKIHLCDPNTGKVSRTLEILAQTSPIPGAKSSEIDEVVFSPDGLRLAVACGDWTAKILDVTTGAEIHSLQPHTGAVSSVAFNGDGRRVATASANMMSVNAPGEVKVWDAASGELLLDLKGHTNRVHSVAFSPDSQWLASASTDRTVRLWNLATGQSLHTLSGHLGTVNRVLFSPDGKRLATAGSHHDHTLKLWDATNGQVLLTLKGHTGSVEGLSYSPDGRRLASASSDGTVKVWDAETGLELLAFKGPVKLFRCVTFSPDSMRLVAGGIYGTATLWDGTAHDRNSPLEIR